MTPPPTSPRLRSIRTRLLILLIVPLVSLVALWAFAASVTVGSALDRNKVRAAYDGIGVPVGDLSVQLQTERGVSLASLTTGGRQAAAVAEQRARTDALLARYRGTALRADAEPETRERLADLTRHLDGLPALRAAVDRGAMTRVDAVEGYSGMVDATLRVISSLIIISDIQLYKSGRALTEMIRSLEFTLRADALVGSAAAAGRRLGGPELLAVTRWAASGRSTFDATLGELAGATRADLERVAASPEYRRLRAAEDALATARPSTSQAPAGEWAQAVRPVTAAFARALHLGGKRLTEDARPIAERIVLRLVVAGGLGLLAVALSILLSIVVGRRLGRELRDLQDGARNLAQERLPGVVARLRRGERVDAAAETPPLTGARTTEVARVADALTQVQRTAIESAIGEAALRDGVNRVFLNLAFRNQSLLHRQLRLLDAMERRATDPEVLDDLFRLDHLTTRMRRHAEGLVILSGAAPGREWSRPAPMADVLRAAVAEVEDYARVDVAASGDEALIGGVVADVVHLLAELVENATVFSPPNTEVTVRGEAVGRGYAIEIIDRGIGIDAAERARLNDLLARPPEFDLADSDRLGLFVVTRLAARHRVRVALQESPYGGTTAIVLVPNALVADPADREPDAPRRTAEVPPAPAVAAAPDPGGGDRPELPRRRRMASLAPQLRAEPEDADDPGDRPAEASRDLWDAMQSGWQRGRDDEGTP
ncbi:nitrate- and nitrite sensing domain-containing protein [Actinomadura flavalba]|uniref:sensor histidine kinase n=1 Tax=Actinomadura flavalba TaxID=1120938 RepID=UPI00039BA619|nr:nitrate- and nitrite sensing domain-containing protein [Actinomadura flavalba]